ncbi:unnamed protein product [Anisakis simplex]|uniref:C2H2-type domain-containing protein n=1 Tax=Anisakis simplex TaxID=6269 RepID=A0A0M3JWD5_ANISI|nr:unnamed protein product [Anisakis simplex]
MGKFASLPTTSHCPPNWTNAIDVNLHTSTGHSHIHPHQQARKRRRGEIANPANTLDGLVAKRADDIGASESLIKRYLTENEAIESPSDDQELKRIETDPDVSTRTCSICGYQGKWDSSTITETHGIRVVSKYSRSKTFDASTTALHELKDNKPEALQTQSKPLPYTINVDPLPPPAINSSPSNKQTTSYLLSSEREHQHDNINKLERAPIAYRCVLCLFEQESLLVLMSHLRNVHNAAFYECRNCACSFMDAMNATEHFDNSSTCSSNALYANIAPIYATQNEHSAFSVCGASKGSSAEELLRGLFNSSSSCANSFLPLIQTLNQSQSFGISTTNCDSNRSLLNVLSTYANLESGACDKCPYKGDNDAFLTHKKGHDIPKGLLNYKCVFCDWFAKRKNSIEEHMRVHTSNPQLYMPQVEKNLITPVTIAKYASDSNAAAAVISSDEHLFGNNSFTNTSRISASAATPEQVR